MRFFRRLGKKTEGQNLGAEPKIRLDLRTWFLPGIVFLANLFLVFPSFNRPLPSVNFAAPILPFLGGGNEEVIRILILGAYVIGPSCFYFYIWEITLRRLTSLLAALIYILFTLRFFQTSVYADGAHIVALSLVPLVLIFLLRFLRLRTIDLGIVASVGIALVALLSPFGLFTLLIFISTLTYSEMLLGEGRRKLIYMILVLIGALGLSAFWYHPGFVINLFFHGPGKELILTIWNIVPLSFFIVPVVGAFSFLIFDRKPALQPFFLAISQFLVFLLLVFVGNYLSASYLSMPSRFLPELSLTAVFLLSLVLVELIKTLQNGWLYVRFRIPRRLSVNLATFLTVMLVTFSLSSILFISPYFWNIEEIETEMVEIKLNGSGTGVGQILGGVITLLTAGFLGYLKFYINRNNKLKLKQNGAGRSGVGYV